MEADGQVRGRVVGEIPTAADCVIVVRAAGCLAFVPARRVTRWSDPTRVYVCADGSLWRDTRAPDRAVAAVVLEAR